MTTPTKAERPTGERELQPQGREPDQWRRAGDGGVQVRHADRSKYPNKPPSVVNPEGKPTGPYTGRCKRCGSDDLWDDCAAYGCNNCGAVYSN